MLINIHETSKISTEGHDCSPRTVATISKNLLLPIPTKFGTPPQNIFLCHPRKILSPHPSKIAPTPKYFPLHLQKGFVPHLKRVLYHKHTPKDFATSHLKFFSIPLPKYFAMQPYLKFSSSHPPKFFHSTPKHFATPTAVPSTTTVCSWFSINIYA